MSCGLGDALRHHSRILRHSNGRTMFIDPDDEASNSIDILTQAEIDELFNKVPGSDDPTVKIPRDEIQWPDTIAKIPLFDPGTFKHTCRCKFSDIWREGCKCGGK